MIGWIVFAAIALLLAHYFHWILDLIDIIAFQLGLIFLFLCIFRKTRLFSAKGLIYCSSVMAITLWVYLLSNTYGAFGFWGVLVGILLAGIGIYITGLIALFWIHQVTWLVWFIIEIIFMLGMRIIGTYIIQKEIDRRDREEEIFLFGDESEEDQVSVEEKPKKKVRHTPSPSSALQTKSFENSLVDFLRTTGQIPKAEDVSDTTVISTEKNCFCDEPLCGKCLMVGCKDKDCSIHTTWRKSQHRQNKRK